MKTLRVRNIRSFVLAAACCVPASLALGVLAGVVHLVAVASGWAYDLVLKPTPASPRLCCSSAPITEPGIRLTRHTPTR